LTTRICLRRELRAMEGSWGWILGDRELCAETVDSRLWFRELGVIEGPHGIAARHPFQWTWCLGFPISWRNHVLMFDRLCLSIDYTVRTYRFEKRVLY
jgi:hypothetical protein